MKPTNAVLLPLLPLPLLVVYREDIRIEIRLLYGVLGFVQTPIYKGAVLPLGFIPSFL